MQDKAGRVRLASQVNIKITLKHHARPDPTVSRRGSRPPKGRSLMISLAPPASTPSVTDASLEQSSTQGSPPTSIAMARASSWYRGAPVSEYLIAGQRAGDVVHVCPARRRDTDSRPYSGEIGVCARHEKSLVLSPAGGRDGRRVSPFPPARARRVGRWRLNACRRALPGDCAVREFKRGAPSILGARVASRAAVWCFFRMRGNDFYPAGRPPTTDHREGLGTLGVTLSAGAGWRGMSWMSWMSWMSSRMAVETSARPCLPYQARALSRWR